MRRVRRRSRSRSDARWQASRHLRQPDLSESTARQAARGQTQTATRARTGGRAMITCVICGRVATSRKSEHTCGDKRCQARHHQAMQTARERRQAGRRMLTCVICQAEVEVSARWHRATCGSAQCQARRHMSCERARYAVRQRVHKPRPNRPTPRTTRPRAFDPRVRLSTCVVCGLKSIAESRNPPPTCGGARCRELHARGIA